MAFPNGTGPSDHFTNINNLNNVSANPYESAGVSDNDLALFTNSEFFDWDATDNLDSKFDPLSAQPSEAGFANGNFNFEDMSMLPNDGFNNQQKLVQPQQQQAWNTHSPSQVSPSAASPDSQASHTPRRRADSTRQSQSGELAQADALQVSAEEDKRRRNTAASARFRIKKKQREQAIEKTAKEMTDRVTSLENKISELEKENKLLKGLLTEKSTSKSEAERSRKRFKREEEA